MSLEEKIYTNAVLESMMQRVSVRHYRPEAIADDLLYTILNAARRSPTSSNLQAYSLIVVKDSAKKQALAKLSGDQEHIETCPVFVAICADTYRLEQAAQLHDAHLGKNFENFLVASVDAALVGMSIQTLAESFGLGGVMIGGMRNHPKEVAELLGLPEGVYVVYGLCLGYPDDEKQAPQKPRLPEQVVIHEERYQTEGLAEQLSAHDEELAAHYRRLGRNQHNAAWTGVIAHKFSKPSRPHLRQTLESMGFVLD